MNSCIAGWLEFESVSVLSWIYVLVDTLTESDAFLSCAKLKVAQWHCKVLASSDRVLEHVPCDVWCVSSQPWNLVSLSEHSNSLNWIDEARRGMSSYYFFEHFQVVGRHFSESKYLMSRDEALTNDLKLFDASQFLLSHLSCRGQMPFRLWGLREPHDPCSIVLTPPL